MRRRRARSDGKNRTIQQLATTHRASVVRLPLVGRQGTVFSNRQDGGSALGQWWLNGRFTDNTVGEQ